MSTQPAEPRLAELPLSTPLEAEVHHSRGVYSWWLDTTRSPTPEAAGLQLPAVRRLRHSWGTAELLYVGRARRDLHGRISGQHLRRTRSSALRRTLLAVLLPGDPSWRDGATLDGRNRVVLDEAHEQRLTAWMQEHLLLGWAGCGTKDDVDALEQRWVAAHQPVLNTESTAHGQELTELKRAYREGLPVRC
ncbi:GIY-YIG nuclease family protein [Kocuria nitroreducens]|uniref:GIY-YIG nuclease family protein n=1 Tax=Kocuria nitroreducens TaxID=3058914 RepID=UPI0036DCAD7F